MSKNFEYCILCINSLSLKTLLSSAKFTFLNFRGVIVDIKDKEVFAVLFNTI